MTDSFGQLAGMYRTMLGFRQSRREQEALDEYRQDVLDLRGQELEQRRIEEQNRFQQQEDANFIKRIQASASESLADVELGKFELERKQKGIEESNRQANIIVNNFTNFGHNSKRLLRNDPNDGLNIDREVLSGAFKANQPWAKEVIIDSAQRSLGFLGEVSDRGFTVTDIVPTRINEAGDQLYAAIGTYEDTGELAPITQDGGTNDESPLGELTLDQMTNIVRQDFRTNVLDTQVGSNISVEAGVAFGLSRDNLRDQDIKLETERAVMTAAEGASMAANDMSFYRGLTALLSGIEDDDERFETLVTVAEDMDLEIAGPARDLLTADAPDAIVGTRGESIGLEGDMPNMDQLRGIFGDAAVDKWQLGAGANLLTEETLFQEGGRIGPLIKSLRKGKVTEPEAAIIVQRDKVLELDREIAGYLKELDNVNLTPRQKSSLEKTLNTAVTNRSEAVIDGNTKVLGLVNQELDNAKDTLSKATGKAKERAQAKVDQLQAEFNGLIKAGVRTSAMQEEAYNNLRDKVFSQEEGQALLTGENPQLAQEILTRAEQAVNSGELSITDGDQSGLLNVLNELKVEPNLDDLVLKAPNESVLLSMVVSAATEPDPNQRTAKFKGMRNYIETGRWSMSGKDLVDATTARIQEARQGTEAVTSLVNAVTAANTEARQLLKQQTDLSREERNQYENEVNAAVNFSASVLGMGVVGEDGTLTINQDEEQNLRRIIAQSSTSQANRKISEAITSLGKEAQKYMGPPDPNTGRQTARNPQALKILDETTNTFLSLYVQKMVANQPGLGWFDEYQLNDPNLQYIRYNEGSDEFIFVGPRGRQGNAVPRKDLAEANAYIADMLMLKVGLNEVLRQGTDE